MSSKNCMELSYIYWFNILYFDIYYQYQVHFNCDKLAAYHVDEQNENYCDIDGVLYTKNKSKLAIYPKGKN